MKKDLLNFKNYIRFFLLLFSMISLNANTYTKDTAQRAELLAQLIQKIGPERAANFFHQLEQKYTNQQTKLATSTSDEKVHETKTSLTLETHITPKHIEQKKESSKIASPRDENLSLSWIEEQESHEIEQVIKHLDTYAKHIYHCIEAFLSKKNSKSLKYHVDCFKEQLLYLQTNLIKEYPTSQSDKGKRLLTSLYEITTALERSQQLMINTLSQEYRGPFALFSLGKKLDGLKGPINTERAKIDRHIGVLRNELRHAHDNKLLDMLNHFYLRANLAFDFGNNKKTQELTSILMLRLK